MLWRFRGVNDSKATNPSSVSALALLSLFDHLICRKTDFAHTSGLLLAGNLAR
jgi:hypothetical protein